MTSLNKNDQTQVPAKKQSFFQWYFSLLNKSSLFAKGYIPSSPLFAAVRIWTIIIVILIVALFILMGVLFTTQVNTPHASSAAYTGAMLAGMLIGAFLPFIITGILAVIPFIMSIVAANKLGWKIQPLERTEMFFLGLLTFMGLLWGYPNIPGLLSLIGKW